MPYRYNARQFLKLRPPKLRLPSAPIPNPPQRITKYVGVLDEWPGFISDAQATFQNYPFKDIVAVLNVPLVGPLSWEELYVTSEVNVRDGFQAHMGEIMNHISRLEDLGFSLEPGCRPNNPGSPTPNSVLRDKLGELLAIGDISVPWPASNGLGVAVDDYRQGRTEHLRKLLGRVSHNMKVRRLKYGYFTTYTETVFLRQKVQHRKWTLEFSPVILHTDRFTRDIHGAPASITSRQGFLHLAMIALLWREFENGTDICSDGESWTVHCDP
ncbi:hypothetical protein N7456_000993 [Penicillium angulare]|uniref:Uncharacterized protein n=1 Tax=Penicillium angulare TaxID=116970 RepID=A0A9W9KSM3_9EURO|nr:hypothetical protein N7456_000993 [Penicillium angulare]